MAKIHIPTYHAKSVYDIPLSFYKEKGIKTILCDLDNTLDSYRQKTPTDKAILLKEELSKVGVELIIVSNNRKDRVGTYAEALGVKYIYSIGKPFPYGINKAIKELALEKESTLLIGDQTVTDIVSANRAHIRCVLTDKIVEEDQPTTYFNRLFDRPIRKWLQRKNLLNEII